MKTLAKSFSAALLLLLAATAAFASEIYGASPEALDYYKGNQLLGQWRVAEARRAVEEMRKIPSKAIAARALDAHVRFFEGDYGGSLNSLEELGVGGGFYELVSATKKAAQNFKSRERDGFRVYWDNPKDEVMAEMALDALAKARKALSDELGFEPEGVVRAEIYPSIPAFTAVSTLTKEEVETSGTIGLCKFNRVMMASPRATVWGFRWLDTLCHEYVHLAIFRQSGGAAPIWVHEGIARHYEGVWRGRAGNPSRFSLALLQKRFKAGTLISLEKMSPSVAKLPSAEDTALAFSEVSTMMGLLLQKRGTGSLKRLVTLIGEGKSDRQALEEVWGGSFDSFYEGWREWVKSLPPQEEDVEVTGIALKSEGREEPLEPGRVADPGAGEYVRLGDMLRARGRNAAAGVEYDKAFAINPKNPSVASRQALGMLWRKDYEKALEAVSGVIDIYEDRTVLWMRKGEALMGLGRFGEASAAFGEIMEINPFDEPARMALYEAYKKAGNSQRAEEELKNLKIISGAGGKNPHDGH